MMTLSQWLSQSLLPKSEARMLLQEVTGLSRAQLITRDAEMLTESQYMMLEKMQQKRLAGEPMAYIVGWREFYSRRFFVSPAVLIPRPETEHIVDAVLERLPSHGRVWDVGTGSGAIAITVALEQPDACVCASDLSLEALEMAKKNANHLNANVHFAEGSWYQTQPSFIPPLFDIIVSNPPYIEADDIHLSQGDLRFEPQQALTDFSNGLTCFETLSQQARSVLKEGGFLIMEHGYNQAEAIRHMLNKYGFDDIQTIFDLAGHERITLGRLVLK